MQTPADGIRKLSSSVSGTRHGCGRSLDAWIPTQNLGWPGERCQTGRMAKFSGLCLTLTSGSPSTYLLNVLFRMAAAQIGVALAVVTIEPF